MSPARCFAGVPKPLITPETAHVPPLASAAGTFAAANGDLRLLEQLHAHHPASISKEKCFLSAVSEAQLPVVQWLLSTGFKISPSLVQQSTLIAAHRGHLAMLSWLSQQIADRTAFHQAILLAASAGDLAAVQALRGIDPPCPWTPDACRLAACAGHVHILEYMQQQQAPGLWETAVPSAAAQAGQLQALQWLHDQWPSPSSWDASVCSAAANGGHLNILIWLRSQNPPSAWDEKTCEQAAGSGCIEVLTWVRCQQPPCPWNKSACNAAASLGRLDTLQWLRDVSIHECPCPWDSGVAVNAVLGGHLHVLQWIHSQQRIQHTAAGSLIDIEVALAACDWQHEHIVHWLLREVLVDDKSRRSLGHCALESRALMQAMITHGLARHLPEHALHTVATLGDAPVLASLLPHFMPEGLLFDALWTVICSSAHPKSENKIRQLEHCYWQRESPCRQHLEVARLLLQQLPSLDGDELWNLGETAADTGSIIPVQLAAMGIQPVIQ